MKLMRFLKLHASIIICLCCASSTAGGAEPVPVAKIVRESARLRALVEFVGKKGANPTVLAREFKKLSAKGVTPGIRREASFRLAGLYREHKNPDGAEKLYEDLARSVDDTWGVRAAVALGDIRRAAGKPDAAVEAYERILRKNITEPAAVRAALGVGLILEKRGDKAEARKAFEYGKAVAKQLYEADRKGLAGVLGEIDAALRRLRPKRKPKPVDAARLLREGNAALHAKKYGAALGKYGKLLEDFPESTEVDETGHKRGLALYLMSKPEEARAAWETFVKDKPEGPWRGHALVGLGDILLEHDLDYAGARRTYEAAHALVEKVAHDPGRAAAPLVCERLGLCDYIGGKFDAAAKWFERASAARSHNPDRAAAGWPREGQWLVDACKRRKPPSPKHLLGQGSQRASLAIFLGDAWSERGRCR